MRTAATAVAFFGLTGNYASGVPASPRPAEFRQPDGRKITLVLKGDEHLHWHEDAGGYAVVKSPDTGQWVRHMNFNCG